MTRRGGRIDFEIEHGEHLLESDPETTWGWGTTAGRFRVAARIAWFHRVLGMHPGQRVLECGCGTGAFTSHLARFPIELTAVDISPDLLERAKARPECRPVTFLRANLESPAGLEDGGFDAICGVSVLHHLDTKAALPALFGKLRPGGLFAFSEPNLLNPLNRYFAYSTDPERRRRWGNNPSEMAFRPDELRHEMERAGFQVLALDHRDFMYPSTPPLLIPIVQGIQTIAESTPLLRRISGSLWISGRRPEAAG